MDQQIYLIIGIIISVAVTLVDLFGSKFVFGGRRDLEELEYVFGVLFAILYIFLWPAALVIILASFLRKFLLTK